MGAETKEAWPYEIVRKNDAWRIIEVYLNSGKDFFNLSLSEKLAATEKLTELLLSHEVDDLIYAAENYLSCLDEIEPREWQKPDEFFIGAFRFYLPDAPKIDYSKF